MITFFISYNVCPLHTRNFFIKQHINNTKAKENDDENNGNKRTVWVTLSYLGDIGDKMKKPCFEKFQ